MAQALITNRTVGGFGLDFGFSFGASTAMGAVTATVTFAAVTSVLAGNGISDATLSEVPALAELQLV